MTNLQKQAPRTIVGFDLTVPDAEPIRDFYASVVGWQPEPFDMGGYSDFFMKAPATGDVVAGGSATRGENADMPPQWLTYVVVEDLESSLQRCVDHGGTLVSAVKGNEGDARYCVIGDPAGAVLALMQLGGD